ncbi:hypothetical protein [Nocardia phage NBR1]|uniref:hypothetical protein n=1 Tax=Nocardia phage NBR1 TaxID=1109711 RepID=UPI00023EEDD7|nr:hypothetical protein NoPhNBR1_gp20 [Nocardia phage NBR1]AEV52233.1 hypothetical protein [Nocardia phage NBR1]
MARTLEFSDLITALHEAFSANAAERWAVEMDQPVFYGSGVRPTVECYPDAEAALDTYIRETEPATQ